MPASKKNRSAQNEARRARERTAQQLERQENVFRMSVVQMKTTREIAKELSISQQTVTSDIRHEAARRADEIKERRAEELARSVSVYQNVQRLALNKGQRYDKVVEKMLDGGGEKGGRASVTDRTLDSIISAQERIDKLLGLDAPTKVEVGLSALLDALTVPDDKA